jgi:hypothetical protein
MKPCLTVVLAIFVIVVSAACGQSSFAQTAPLRKLPAHTFVSTMSWWDSIYRFPEFQLGRIKYFTEFSPDALFQLNYNLYYGGIDFIGDKGDTLQMKPLKTIERIEIGGHLFYYDMHVGYVELLTRGSISLGVYTILNTEKMVYVSGNTEGSVNTDLRGLPSVYDRYYREISKYYLLDGNHKFYRALKPAILKLFPGHKEAIEEYIRQHHVNFNSSEDLIDLVNHCNDLHEISEHDSTGFFLAAGTNLSKVWRDSIYMFPDFTKAKLVFRDNSTKEIESGINVNLFTGDIETINADGDTIKMRNTADITTLLVGNKIIYHDYYHGYIEVLLNSGISLGVSHYLRVKKSAVSLANVMASTDDMLQRTFYKNSYDNYTVSFDRLFRKEKKYFFIGDNRQLEEANELSIQRLLPEKKFVLGKYIRRNNTNFKIEEDLRRLIRFCSTTMKPD